MGRVGHRTYVVALTAAYLVVLALVVTSPWGWELNRLTVRLWAFFRDWPVIPERVGPPHYGVLLNVLLFVPVGVLGVLAARRPWWWVTLAALGGSSLVELAQWRWLERDGSWGDVAANTCGALLGALVGAVGVSWWSPGPRRPAPAPSRARQH